MPVGLTDIPRSEFGSGFSVQPKDMGVNLATRSIPVALGTIPTTGTLEALVIIPCAGTIKAIRFVGKDTLAANDTNFVTFTVTNKGAAGAGSTTVLASSPAGTNTTKVTGGSALTAYVPGSLVLSGTAGNLVVAKNDVLSILATITNTLNNTVTLSRVEIEITPAAG